jgi:hypothetical protein
MLRQLDRRQEGQGLVLLVLSAVVIVGMLALGIDGGSLYLQRRRTQIAADAGALAGASALVNGGSDEEILAAVRRYAVARNDADDFRAFYIPSGHEVGAGYTPSDARGIRVAAEAAAPTFFAGMPGFGSGNTSAVAGGGFPPLDIMLVLDRSGSMDDDSCSLQSARCTIDRKSRCEACGGVWLVPPQPLTDAKEAAKAFVAMNNANLTRLGLASYAASASLDQPLTNQFHQVDAAIDGLVADGCTNAADGIRTAHRELTGARSREDALRIMVFLTDGLPNYPQCSDCRDYCPAAKQAARDRAMGAGGDGIVIYTIGLGSKADGALMQDIADLAGGQYYYAPTSDDLLGVYEAVFDEIRLRLIE